MEGTPLGALPSIGTKSKEKRQYQHHIPRFILRNFAHHDEQVGERSGLKRRRKNKKPQKLGRPNTLYLLKLQPGKEPQVCLKENFLRKEFGAWDMYRDLQHAVDQNHIEKKLAHLEGQASLIIHKIRSAQEQGEQSAEITRLERDELRKFLFIQKYRGSNQHRRFYNKDLDTYSANDKETMVKYMRDRGFQKPIEVWYDNIEKLMSLELDTADDWVKRLSDSIYPGDAQWAIATLRQKYVAFCVPADDRDEFILTENAYSIHEGPVSSFTDPVTGEETGAYTEYHNFAPISPKLMVVLRSTLLPNPVEDVIPGLRQERELVRMMETIQHGKDGMTRSLFEHLPVWKARASYIRMDEGTPMLAEGEDGSRRADHRFRFPFFSVSSDYVQKINAVMLEESQTISTIAFASHQGARRALEYYLALESAEEGVYPLKMVSSLEDPKFWHLVMLEQAARLLGSDVATKIHVERENSDTTSRSREEALEILREMIAASIAERNAASDGVERTSQSSDHMVRSEPVNGESQRDQPQGPEDSITDDGSEQPAGEKHPSAEETVKQQTHQQPSSSNRNVRRGPRPGKRSTDDRRKGSQQRQRPQEPAVSKRTQIEDVLPPGVILLGFVVIPVAIISGLFFRIYQKLIDELRVPKKATSQTAHSPTQERTDTSRKEPHYRGVTMETLLIVMLSVLSALAVCITGFALYCVAMRDLLYQCVFIGGQVYQILSSFVVRYGG